MPAGRRAARPSACERTGEVGPLAWATLFGLGGYGFGAARVAGLERIGHDAELGLRVVAVAALAWEVVQHRRARSHAGAAAAGGASTSAERRRGARRLYSPLAFRPSPTMRLLPPPPRAFVALVLAFLSLAAWAQPAALPAGVTQGASVEGITEYRLGNGLRVLLFPDASKPTTTVNMTYLVGSRHESYGETGMAHLLEHLVFKSTPTIPSIFQELGRRGMRFNGTTSFDRTNYFETFTANEENLEWALRMEAERMTQSGFAKSDLDTEMTVVRNEFEMGENSPQRVLWKRVQAQAYDFHNYGNVTIGSRADVENVRHRPAARVLPHVLPAGQRGADRRRPLRSGAHARADREDLRPDPEADAHAAQALHGRPRAGRRAVRHRAPRRLGEGDRGAVPRDARLASRLRRAGRAGRRAHHRARGTAVPGARRDQEGHGRRDLVVCAPRPRPHHLLGPAAARGGRRAGAGDDARDDRERGEGARHAGRGGPRAHPRPHRLRPIDERSPEGWGGALRGDLAGRLAPAVPRPRPPACGDGRRRQPRGRGLPQAGQPHGRRVPARSHPGPRGGGRRRRRRRHGEGLQGRHGDRGGRDLRPQPGQPRRAHRALHAAGRHEGGPAAQEDPRRCRALLAATAPGRPSRA